MSAKIRRLLASPAIPFLGTSQIGVCLVLVTVALHLFVAALGVDAGGEIFRGGPLVEAFGQALLIVAPLAALWAGVRGALSDRDDVLAYVAVAGGGSLGLLTLSSLIFVALQ